MDGKNIKNECNQEQLFIENTTWNILQMRLQNKIS